MWLWYFFGLVEVDGVWHMMLCVCVRACMQDNSRLLVIRLIQVQVNGG